MSYKALYRKYRPNSFEEIAGQKHIVQTLKHAIKKNKIAHAYLFCGPRGTGKTSVAKIFAKTVNCIGENKPCLKCDNCLAIKDGSHPDVIEIDAASNNGVDEVRSLIEKVKYAPLKGKYKIYIIDEVHMMSTGAFNALLKTIEEPPAHVIFILATTEPYKILPTIISRCQRFDFNKVAKSEMISRIKVILNEEQIVCDENVIELIAQLADGGLRDALSILDQCIAYAQNNIKEHHINEIYGIVSVEEKVKLFERMINNDAMYLMNKCDEWIEKGIDIPRLTSDFIDLFKESLIYQYTKDKKLLNKLNEEQVNYLIQNIKKNKRYQLIDILMKTYDKYRFASSVSSYFQICLLEMMDECIVNENTIQETVETVINKNVSRETLINVKQNEVKEKTIEKIEPTIKPLKNEFVLQLLVGANKPEKANDMSKMQDVNKYLIDIKVARYAMMIKNTKIIASSDTYIVVSVANQAQANEINELDKNEMFVSFIKMMLGKPKKVFAVSQDHSNEIIEEFKVRMKNKTLPKAIQFEIKEKEEVKLEEKTQEELVIDLFGKENVIITEE